MFAGCGSDDKQALKNDIIGTWKLVETYGSDGAHGQWYPVENGYTYTFENGNLISNRYSCNGTYQKEADNKITLKFECSDSRIYEACDFWFEDDMLILAPTNCIEGCMQKYVRNDVICGTSTN